MKESSSGTQFYGADYRNDVVKARSGQSRNCHFSDHVAELLCGTYVSHYLMVQETKTENFLDSS